MDADAFVDGDFGFEVTSGFVRERARLVGDPYDPDAPGVPDWSDPDRLPVDAYFASQSSTEQSDPVRAQLVTTKQLVFDDPHVDVRRGDRIRLGSSVWVVTGFPEADVNPFTGWQPTLVCNLEEVVG